jgi:MFS family permease
LRLLHVLFLVLLFLFYHINMYVEQVMMSYLTSFAIKYLGWSVQQASNVLSLYYLFHFGSRVAAIAIIAFMQPRTMMACNISITAVACLMLLAVNVWPSMLWISSALIGYGVASTFSTGILWISATIRVTGRVSSTFIIGSSSGSMVAPLIVGLLFDNATPMAFVYMLIAAIFCHATLFGIINVYIRRYGGEFGIRAETADVELSVSESAETSETDYTTYF